MSGWSHQPMESLLHWWLNKRQISMLNRAISHSSSLLQKSQTFVHSNFLAEKMEGISNRWHGCAVDNRPSTSNEEKPSETERLNITAELLHNVLYGKSTSSPMKSVSPFPGKRVLNCCRLFFGPYTAKNSV